VPRPPLAGVRQAGGRTRAQRHVLSNVLTDRGNLHLDGSPHAGAIAGHAADSVTTIRPPVGGRSVCRRLPDRQDSHIYNGQKQLYYLPNALLHGTGDLGTLLQSATASNI
jgi:hypothetical protein